MATGNDMFLYFDALLRACWPDSPEMWTETP